MNVRLTRDAAIVAGPKVLGGATLLALNVWLAATLGPAAFGELALCLAVAFIVEGVVGSGIDVAVLRNAGSGRSEPFERAGVTLKAGVVTALAAALLVAGDRLAAAPFRPLDAGLLSAAVLVGGAFASMRSAQCHWQIRQAFWRHAGLDAAQAGLRGALLLAAITFGRTSTASLLAAWAIASLVPAAPALWALRGRTADDGVALRTVARTAARTGPTFAVGALNARIDVLILGACAPPAELGLYTAAQAIATLPELAGGYLTPIFAPRIAAWCDTGEMADIVRRSQLTLIALAAAAGVLGLVVAPAALAVVLPASYAASVTTFRLLWIGSLALFVSLPLTLYLLMFTMPRQILWMEVVTTPVLAVACWVAATRQGAVGVAVVIAATRVVKTVVAQYLGARLAARETRRGAAALTVASSGVTP
jgi:O-antigen/teichoic acid export membrane protein